MTILDGKKAKKEMLIKLKEDLLKLDRQLGLTIIQVGEDKASSIYVKQKEKLAYELNFNFKHIKLNNNIALEDLLKVIEKENNDISVDGIIVQMPLPKHLDYKVIQNTVIPSKDIDGLTDINAGKLSHNVECLTPCTPTGIIELINYYNINISGSNVVIIGRSDLVGKPLYQLFLNNDATVTICHSKTKDLKSYTTKADILVAAVGIPNFIKDDMVKEGAVVIDVGINRVDDKICGDVDFESVSKKASFITPVPGGVGQMTTLEIGKNLYKAYKLNNS